MSGLCSPAAQVLAKTTLLEQIEVVPAEPTTSVRLALKTANSVQPVTHAQAPQATQWSAQTASTPLRDQPAVRVAQLASCADLRIRCQSCVQTEPTPPMA